MANINNPHYLSKMYNAALSVTPNAEDQIEDSIDNPHTGLIKGLSLLARGNHAVKRTNGFDIVTSNATQFTVTAGKFYRDGKLETATNSNSPFTLSYGGAAFPAVSSNDGVYFLLVVNSANALVVRSPNPAAFNKVPTHQAGDVIIAVLGYTGNATDGSQLLVQFITTDKTTNSVSIGYEASNQYEEAGNLTGTSDGITMTGLYKLDTLPTATVAGTDKIIIQDTNDADIIKTVTATQVAALAPTPAITAINNATENELVTVGATTTELEAEAGLTYNGSILSVTGAVGATSVTTSGAIISTGNNIAANAGSVSGVSIGAGTSGISNLGGYTQSFQLAADANTGGYTSVTGHTEIVPALLNPINPTKEHYYVGIDTTVDATHAAGTPITPTGATGEFQLLTVANEANRVAGNLTTHTYPVDSVFGGNTFFIGIERPESHSGKTVSITNITAYGMYVLVANEDALDPGNVVERRKIHGGVFRSTHGIGGLNQLGNTRCVNMSRIVCGASPFYTHTSGATGASMYGEDWDAILVKPRETITISAIQLMAENPGTHYQDVFNEQGLYSFPAGVPAHSSLPPNTTGMWMLKSVTSSGGFANVTIANAAINAFVHIPVWMTGTTFICSGAMNFMLPSHPPIGTQFAFLVKDGTTTVDRITLGGSEAHMASSYAASAAQDEFYSLATSVTAAPLSITATNGKTFIYTQNNNWEVIG